MDISETLGISFGELFLYIFLADILIIGFYIIVTKIRGKDIKVNLFVLACGIYVLLFFIALFIDTYISSWKGGLPSESLW